MKILIGGLLMLLLFGCGVTSAEKTAKPKDRTLPKYSECDRMPKVFDGDITYRRQPDLSELSYAYTYNSVSFQGDSLIREEIRQANANLAREVVKHNFPDIELVKDHKLKNKTYKEIFLAESYIYSQFDYLTGQGNRYIDHKTGKIANNKPGEKNIRKAEQSIEDLTVPSESNTQLFIAIRTYLYGRDFNNIIKIYVFNKSDSRIDYFDRLEYKCDIRDQKTLTKVLNYGLEKMNSN